MTATPVFGAPEGWDAFLLARRRGEFAGPVVHVTRDDARMARLAEALAFVAPEAEVLRFPAWDCLPYDRVSPNPALVSERIATLVPAIKNVIGILVHVQYKTSVLEILAKTKIDLVADFDPTDPKHIFDPKHDSLSASDRVQLALSIHHTRCIRALKYMRSQVATAVARTFLEAGWITESDVPRPRYIDLDDPTDAFRQSDADGEHDSMSDCSDIQDQ